MRAVGFVGSGGSRRNLTADPIALRSFAWEFFLARFSPWPVSDSRTAFKFQHAKRPPARSQRALAFSSFQRGSVLRQLVEQAGLKRLQGPLLLAEDVSLRLASALSSERVAVEGVVGLRPAQAGVPWRVFHRKNRMREICTSGSVSRPAGNRWPYSAEQLGLHQGDRRRAV